jgi:hypothetical protein
MPASLVYRQLSYLDISMSMKVLFHFSRVGHLPRQLQHFQCTVILSHISVSLGIQYFRN